MTVEIVSDSTCSFNPGDKEVVSLGIHVIPIRTNFVIGGENITIEDGTITPEEFYAKMKLCDALPTTDSAIGGPALNLYSRLASDGKTAIISIHCGFDISTAPVNSADTAANQVMEEQKKTGLTIKVIDSRRISLPLWFLVEDAAHLANQGVGLEEIKQAVLTRIPKTGIYVGLSTYENLVKGGRVSRAKAWAATALNTYPILGIIGQSGVIEPLERVRTTGKIPQRLLESIKTVGKVEKLAVLHTNALTMAEDLRDSLQEIYPGKILIKDIGASPIGVHVGEGGLGVAFMTE